MVIGPYGILRVRMGACEFVMSYRAGGVEPRPYGVTVKFYEFAGVHTYLQLHPAREGQAPPLRYDEKRKAPQEGRCCHRPLQGR